MGILTLDEDIFTWLTQLDVIPNEGKKVGNNKLEIPSNISTYLENGILIGKLVLQLQKQLKLYNVSFTNMESFKD